MDECFIYKFVHGRDESHERVTVVFLPYKGVTADRLAPKLQAYFDTSLVSDRVLLLGPEACRDDIRHLLASGSLETAVPLLTRLKVEGGVAGACMNGGGVFTPVDPFEEGGRSETYLANLQTIFRDEFWAVLKREGLMHIFEIRRGMLDTKGMYHFVKPSGGHSDRFIRTANVLLYGGEIAFIAFWLLPYMKDGIDRVYTDTAAVNSVVYALTVMKMEASAKFRMPVISSFGSYRGLEEFEFDRGALIVISASTGGDLEDKLLQRRIGAAQMVTLFYLGQTTRERQVICDLTQTLEQWGHEPIKTHSPEKCPLCRDLELKAVSLIGDQFLPEEPVVKTQLIFPGERPSWLNAFVRATLGTSVIRCHCDDREMPSRTREIFLDLPRLLAHPEKPEDGSTAVVEDINFQNAMKGSPFLRRMNRLLDQIIPASLRHIIHLDDPASKALAQQVGRRYRRHGKDEPRVISMKAIEEDPKSYRLKEGATLVVAGAVVSGRRLVSISQILRQIGGALSLQYLVGVCRTRSNGWLDDVRSTLEYGEMGAHDYDFHTVFQIFIPDDSPYRPSSWTREEMFLSEQLMLFSGAGDVAQISQRRDLLRKAPSEGGLLNNLFWNSSYDASKPLRLTRGFSLWADKGQEEKATQADVYFTMNATLHRLREVSSREGLVSAYEPHRVILSPLCFDRYNDGVIQASLLRAAYDAELNYEHTAHSEIMQEVVDLILEPGKRRGEARTEFLLALAMRKLRLNDQHLRQCLDNAGRFAQELSGVDRLLIAFMKSKILAP